MRSLPLLLMFVVGLTLGVLIGRMTADEGTPPAVGVATESVQPAPSRDGDPVVVFAPPAQSRPAAAPSQARSADTAVPIHHADPAPPAAGVEASGGGQRIDAGPVFNRQFAASEKQGVKDAMLEAHRALEREPRDDSWSYPLEAEIENSLVADTSMGNFRREHLECRTSGCEIRLSAEGGAQIEALQQWTSDIQKLPWASRMVLSSSSTVSDADRMDVLLIVTKPPSPAQD
jgi:hypothetical protein